MNYSSNERVCHVRTRQVAERSVDVVGLGASAGGLEVLKQLFARIPANTGLAFVVVQHLDRSHRSLLSEILARHTRMPVCEATDGIRVQPDHVYVVPPNAQLRLERNTLRVEPPAELGLRLPVDSFLRSLAEERGADAVGIVLSGAGADGTMGLRAVRELGGLTIVQAPETAEHDGMPQSAIQAGLADFVLPIEDIPSRLLAYQRERGAAEAEVERTLESEIIANLGAICAVLKRRTGHDFGRYRQGTLVRRIERRLRARHLGSTADYVRCLEDDAIEPELLLKDLLINVTQFFRDPEAFQVLAELVLPSIFAGRPADGPVRIWVPGCASGEEAYSIAMLVCEHRTRADDTRPVQIFATDIDMEQLAQARHGVYSDDEVQGRVSQERLERFFTRQADDWRVIKELRDMCVISAHNLVRDPPFSSLDLISCRNVFIYLEAELQRALVPLFHYALRPGGHVFLGPAEGLTGYPELFSTVDKGHRIFRRNETASRPRLELPLSSRSVPISAAPDSGHGAIVPRTRSAMSESFERVMLAEYVPPCAVIDERGAILYTAGRTGLYLQPPPGAPNAAHDIFDMTHGSLNLELRAALNRAARLIRKVVRKRVPVEVDGRTRYLRVTVRPYPGAHADSRLFLVVLEEGALSEETEPAESIQETESSVADAPAVDELESELRSVRADLQSAMDELGAMNADLRSSNEELMSTNEELQSANDELQTSKEELQSINEELESINAELHEKVKELAHANTELQNLYASSQIATVFIDDQLRIARFTPAAKTLLHLIDADVGRPVADLAQRFEGEHLVSDAEDSLRTGAMFQRQVRAAEGQWFIKRLLPYRTLDDRIAAVSVTFVDITELKKAEAALRESEAKFRTLFETMTEGFLIADILFDAAGKAFDMRYVEVNPAFERYLGVAAKDVLGRANSEVFPDSESIWDARLGNVALTGEPMHFEARVGVLDRWFDVSAYRTDKGRVAIVLADITDRKRAEDALRESERRFRTMADSIPQLAWIANPDGHIYWYNQRWYGYTGTVPEQMEGWGWQSVHDPAALPLVLERWKESIATGSPFDMEFPIRGADGRFRRFLTRVVPLRDSGGRVVQWFGTNTDVTDIVETQAALRRERDLNSAVVDTAGALVMVLDRERRIKRFNRACEAATGYSASEVIDRVFDFLIPPEHMPAVEATWNVLLEGSVPNGHENDWLAKDGSRRLISWANTAIIASDGVVDFVVATGVDITERSRAEAALRESEAALREADRQKNQFLAVLSHELRNPLAPIRNSLYILDHATSGTEQARRALAVIDRQIAHMTRLIDDLLDVTRITRGKVQLQAERLDFNELAQRTVEDHRSIFNQGGVELEILPEAVPVWVKGDRTRLAQVIGNLLQNAAKFTPKGGKATVSVRLDSVVSQAVLTVRDDGVGISPDLLPRLFQTFMQADTSLDRSKGGLGLGLALVKGLVELHEGTVFASSDGAGRGAAFTIALPLDGSAVRRNAAPRVPGDGASACRVLIIEDNIDAADSLREVLELGAHPVSVAHSGAAGIEKVRSFRPDVVLCDIGLPGMDGYEVARTLRAEPGLAAVSLVALSGYAQPEDIAKGREAGFDHHIAKPPDVDEIERVLGRLCVRAAG